MEIEKGFTFTGKTYDEAVIALGKLEELIMKKPDKLNLYRFAYVSIEDVHEVDCKVSEGGSFKNGRKKDLEKLFADARELLERNKDLTRFYISGHVKKYS